MKKNILILLSVFFLTQAFAAQTIRAGEETVEEAGETAEEKDSGDMVLSYLTGEPVPEQIGRRRPIAVMMNNIREGCPQSGIASAGVVYEATVEGEITRLMGIIDDYDDLERIGSVRSCRDYYLFYASEFDAIYCHYGQSVFARDYLAMGEVDCINGLTQGSAYFRTSDRKAPHNAYTDYEHIQSGIEALGYSQEYSGDYDGHYLFEPEGRDNPMEGGTKAEEVHLDNFKHNKPWFEYDASAGTYRRFQFGAEQIDELTGEQLECDNIILQYTPYTNYPGTSYQMVDTNIGGTGKYISRGKAIDIRWIKDSPWGVTHYYYEDGSAEILFNTGVTWVEIVQDDRLDLVTCQ